MDPRNVLVVGAGIFGVTAALELRRRGHVVTLLDPGPIPHPLGASHDVSKAVRIDYGADRLTTDLARQARDGWHAWNRTWGEELYHEEGSLFLTREPFHPGSYEFESYRLLRELGHDLERLTPAALRKRFDAWSTVWRDGYFNGDDGWVESGRVVACLVEEGREAGVVLREGAAVSHWLVRSGLAASDLFAVRPSDAASERGARDALVPVGTPLPRGTILCGALTEDRVEHRADAIVVAAGAWTASLLPHLAGILRPVAQPVFHLRPEQPERFAHPAFTTFAADITSTGWYGFALGADDTVKLAHHGTGTPVAPDDPRETTTEQRAALRRFLAESLPSLADAPIDRSHVCLYCDTPDGQLWIDQDSEHPGLVVASGGCGHAFKFAPVLGALVADAVEGRTEPRFAWRPARAGPGDAARRRD